MTTFDALGIPIFESTDKIASSTDGLLQDLNLIGASARTAIIAEGARAEGAAKTYANNKDTTNRAAWSSADNVTLNAAKAYSDDLGSFISGGQASQNGRLALLENAAGFTAPPLGFEDAVVAGLLGSATTTRAGLDGRYVRQGHHGVSPREFGALGDGAADDTAALQAWLDSPNPAKIGGGGVYRITGNLNCSLPNVRILGPGTIKADTVGIDMLNLTGAGALVSGLTLDGNGKARYGIYATGAGTVIERCIIGGMFSATGSPRGIFTSTPGGVTIRNNHVSNVNAPGNATQGDSNGMARGIVMHSLSACTGPSFCIGNIVDNISGEEADAIVVLYSDTVVTTYLPGYTLIKDNMIRNSGRRYIKIQGSNVIIDGNWCWSTPGFTVTNPSNIIDIIQGSNIQITGNRVEEVAMLSPVSIAGASTERITNITVRGNYLSEGDGTNPVIFVSYADNVSVSGNELVGGTYYVQGGTCDGLIVTTNNCRAGVTANPSFSFTSTAVGKVRLNTIPTGRAVGTATGVTFDGNA